MYRYIIFISIICWTNYLVGQEEKKKDLSVFDQARIYAFEENNFEKAINYTQEALNLSPKDSELSLFLAKLHFWSMDHSEASKVVEKVLDSNSHNYQAHKLNIDIFESQQLHHLAIEKINSALLNFPDDTQLRYRLAFNLSQDKRYSEAMDLTSELKDEDPKNEKVRKLHNEIKKKGSLNFLVAEYRHFFLDTKEQVLNFQTIQYGRNIKKTTILIGLASGKTNTTNKGLQYNLEMYNKLGEKYYSYVHFGFSGSDLFPTLRLNTAIYKSFSHNIEGSIYISLIQDNENSIRVVAPSLTKNFNNTSFTGSVNLINKSYENEATYRVRFRQYIVRNCIWQLFK